MIRFHASRILRTSYLVIMAALRSDFSCCWQQVRVCDKVMKYVADCSGYLVPRTERLQ